MKNYQIRNRLIKNEQSRIRSQEKRRKIIGILGGKCIRCGFDDVRALQIDHIKGGGTKEQRDANSRGHYQRYLYDQLKDIERFLSKYQLLCANCNWIKRYENNEVVNYFEK